ncbi:MAG: Hpt domain-containing protein [Bdellovibrionales bacterium]
MSNFKIIFNEDLKEILPSFMDLTEKDMLELGRAVNNGDFSKINSIAHSLKGDSGGYGFNDLSDLAFKLEIFSNAEDLEATKEQYIFIIDHWNELKESYSKWKVS